jgi:hypothetical protein
MPHWLYVFVTAEGKIAVLVLWRARPNSDWALSDSALQYFANAVREGRVAEGDIALTEGWRVLHHLPVLQVVANIGSTEPLLGRFGPYHWLDQDLRPVARAGAVSEDDPL